MGKEIDWVREERTGRLIFRRRYPTDVQKITGKLELKVPLGARWRMTEAASRAYYEACRRFDREVSAARGALRIGAKEQAAAFDKLTPDVIERLTAVLIHDRRTGMDQKVQQGHARHAGEIWATVLPAIREARVNRNHDVLEGAFGPTADDLLISEGLRMDPADVDGRRSLIWALSSGIVGEGENFLAQAQGFSPPLPPRPVAPPSPRGGKRTVAALIKAYKAAKWDGWSQSSRAAVVPAFRVLEDAVGDKLVTDVDRDAARGVFELVKSLPRAIGRNKDLKDLPIMEAIQLGKKLGLTPIGPKTVNGSYMAHISAAFGWAAEEEWTPKNPFRGLSAADPVADQDKRDPFTADQLKTLFASAPWDAPLAAEADKPGAYWLPLIALFTGARLGEIAGLRLMDVADLEGVPALRIRPYKDRTIKNDGSRRDLPVHSALIKLGLLAFVAKRRKEADPAELLFPDGKANVRGQWGAKLSERFGALVKGHKMAGTKLGIHSFRHNWEDRLKAVGLYGTPVGRALGGRKTAGSEATYGSWGFPIDVLQEELEKVSYPGLDLTHLAPAGG
jgi:integrase